MKRIVIAAGLRLLAAGLMLCHKQPDVEADKTAVKGLVKNDTTWFNASTSAGSNSDTTVVPLSVDTLLGWWRGVQTHSDPDVDVEVSGDSAYVDWSRHDYGDLNILLRIRHDTSWTHWVKKVAETSRLRGISRCVGNDTDSSRGWKLQAISLASGTSDSVTGVKIDSLKIQSATNPSLVIRDPLNTFYRLDSLIHFTPLEQATVTLYTNTTDGNAFLHTFILAFPFYVRLNFNNLGNGVYSGTWDAQRVASPRFAIFDLMDHGTLYSPPDVYGYDFNGWQFPYAVHAAD